MKKRIVLFSVTLILISAMITAILSIRGNVKNFVEEKDQELLNYCRLINRSINEDYNHGLSPDFSYYADVFSNETGQRVTFIANNGLVLGDSLAGAAYESMENHQDREEVKEAFQQGVGICNRESETFGNGFLYVASALQRNGETILITRVAMEINSLELITRFMIRNSLIYAAVGTLLSLLIGIFYANRLMRPVNEMERQLIQTMEENQKAESIRKEFVANVTHELKTPLTSISGFVETLQAGAADDPEVRGKFLDIISIEAARLKRLIEDILIISDIENKREANSDQDINVAEAIEETLKAIEPVIMAKNVTIKTNFEYEMYLGGNADRFKQLMMNLIENAVKYSYAGGTVTVTAEKRDGRICISVQDEGIGIAAEHLPRLFERFYRVDKSRSHKAGGTGLGLAIVKHIASLFEAEISVSSEPGKGSTFTVLFKQDERRKRND